MIRSHSCRCCRMPASCFCPCRLGSLCLRGHLISALSSLLLCPRCTHIGLLIHNRHTGHPLTTHPWSATFSCLAQSHSESSSFCCQHWHWAWYPKSLQSHQKMNSEGRCHQNWQPVHWCYRRDLWWSPPACPLLCWIPWSNYRFLPHRASSHWD